MAPYTRSMRRRSQIRDWAQLQMEILDLILQRLLHPDCLNFGQVCRSWRSVFVDRRELILHRAIFQRGQLLRLFSPKLNSFDRIVGSCFGWLVIACPLTLCMILYLLNPATNERIPLPSLSFCSIVRIDLSSRPTNDTCVLVARVLFERNQIHHLLRCRPGDKQWRIGILQPRDHLQHCLDSTFHKGKLYLLCKNGDIVVYNFNPQPIILTQVLNNSFCNINQLQFKRLVQSNGRLLLLVHQTADDQLLVFRNGEELGDKWVRVDSLGDQVLLIGIHGAESICTKDLMGSTYEPNYIYYWTVNESVKKYSMVDGRM